MPQQLLQVREIAMPASACCRPSSAGTRESKLCHETHQLCTYLDVVVRGIQYRPPCYISFPLYNTTTGTMLGDEEDVFDSVTWESPADKGYDAQPTAVPSGPGFIQSTSESEEGRDPNEPKWEGYLITSVKDPVKELPETKDTYVSYLVSAEVRVSCIPATQLIDIVNI